MWWIFERVNVRVKDFLFVVAEHLEMNRKIRWQRKLRMIRSIYWRSAFVVFDKINKSSLHFLDPFSLIDDDDEAKQNLEWMNERRRFERREGQHCWTDRLVKSGSHRFESNFFRWKTSKMFFKWKFIDILFEFICSVSKE